MLRSCIPSFPHLPIISYLFSHTSPSAPPSYPSCDLTALPYTSWRPPTCVQKCAGLCPHLPSGRETHANGRLVDTLTKEKEPEAIAKAQRENAVIAAAHGKQETNNGASGAGTRLLMVAGRSAEQNVKGGEPTPDFGSLLDYHEDDGGEEVSLYASKQSSAARRTTDWLATQASPFDGEDEAVLALDDAGLDYEGVDVPSARLSADQALCGFDAAPRGDGQVDTYLADEDLYASDIEAIFDESECVKKVYRRPTGRAGRSGYDIDIWCEIAASSGVVSEAAQGVGENVDMEQDAGKQRSLSHGFFFE